MRSVFSLHMPFILLLSIIVAGCENPAKQLVKSATNDSAYVSSPGNSKVANDLEKITLAFVPNEAGRLEPSDISRQSDNYILRIEGPASSGSGVIVSKDNRTYGFLTAWHVLQSHNKGEELFVVTNDGTRHDVDQESIRRIPGVDLVFGIFSSKQQYKQVPIESSSRIISGDDLYVAGYPLPTSAVPKSVKRFLSGSVIAISNQQQSDGYELMYSNPAMPGMSGGPVLSTRVGSLAFMVEPKVTS